MKKYVAELLGTFFLVFTVGNTMIPEDGRALAPLAIGLSLMAMTFAGAHISGAHFNSAVTLAVWWRGKCDMKDVVPYIASQLIGAVLAALVVIYLQGTKGTPGDVNLGRMFLAELFGTLVLAWVVLNVATTKANANNSFYGLAIGMTVTAMAFSLGPISGAAFNPAVAIGAVAMGLIKGGNLWLYLVACSLGGLAAGQLFKSLKVDK